MTTSNSPPPQSTATSQPAAQGSPATITPDLVKKIAAKVYALLMADIVTERERYRYSSQKLRNRGGGRYGV